MATKATFKQNEWQTLQWAVSDTMLYLSMANPGFWDMFKEASAATKFIAGVKTSGENDLIRALAADTKVKHDKGRSGDSQHIADGVTTRLREAVSIVTEKAPEDLEAFESLHPRRRHRYGQRRRGHRYRRSRGHREGQGRARLNEPLRASPRRSAKSRRPRAREPGPQR